MCSSCHYESIEPTMEKPTMGRPPLTFQTPARDRYRDIQRVFYSKKKLWNSYQRKRQSRVKHRKMRHLFRHVKRLIRFCKRMFEDFPVTVTNLL